MVQAKCLQALMGMVVLLASVLCMSIDATAEPVPANDAVRTYGCRRTNHAINVDGRSDEPAWAAARWTDPFVDIVGSARRAPAWQTRVKMLWDDRFLYVYAELEEPHVRATLSEKNSMLYRENAFEVFLDPLGKGVDYYEFEINALGTIWELTLNRPYRRGGKATSGTNLPSLRSAVRVDGTLNDPRDVDRKWSVEIAIPLDELRTIKVPAKLPLASGQEWRINFCRVQWSYELVDGKYVQVPKERRPSDNWVWSPQGAVDMHLPEKWGVVRFID